ncbi:MAG: hypothetical protein P0Y65_10050 [Candidatus Devosia phytovorans]|uniref:Uncharacterized protein n=1 Tax=Candidatus Devosia phytovorans TaxID=3121372 RepID=A0AAJ6B196_9HYPH|nr:hypothetical protein [Devosia sp.]WEK06560.1 MAG: hypothetical protein P0Y65_10050 [Devosia sp.]
MHRTHNDLPITGYALLGLLAIGHEALGLQGAVTLGIGLGAAWVLLSLAAALLEQLRKTPADARLPPKRVGR